jgi:hypothetical protein
MSQDPGSGSDESPRPLSQHHLVGRLKPDPSQPAQQVTELAGLPGDSDRAGYQRLYLTARLDYYAEFLVQDLVYSEALPADQSPLPGLVATKAGIRRAATISYTWVRSPHPVDEFDLDVRLGGAGAGEAAIPHFAGRPASVYTCGYTCICGGGTAGSCTCPTLCGQATCTCNTQCGQATCAGTCATCDTACGQATCANTCAVTCGATCDTCPGQATCHTCDTCPQICTHQNTCRNTCGC